MKLKNIPYIYLTKYGRITKSRLIQRWLGFVLFLTVGVLIMMLMLRISINKNPYSSNNYDINHNRNVLKSLSVQILDLESMDYPERTISEVESTIERSFPTKINSQRVISNNEYGGEKIAVIVPYRQRASQLVTFLRHIHPFLIGQNNDYRIFVINQTDSVPFNRATLLNIGFIESQKFGKYNCFVFTDVDLLPQNQLHSYDCQRSPEHLSKSIDVMQYRLPYPNILGGAVAINKEHFQLVNGFSNLFWGWGGEDDDFSFRIRSNNLTIHRKGDQVARYKMNKHVHIRANNNVNKDRFWLLKKSNLLRFVSGINNITYNVTSTVVSMLFTSINVDLTESYNRCINSVDSIKNL